MAENGVADGVHFCLSLRPLVHLERCEESNIATLCRKMHRSMLDFLPRALQKINIILLM